MTDYLKTKLKQSVTFTIKSSTIVFLGIGSYTWPWAVERCRYSGDDAISAARILEYAAANDIRFVQFCDNMPLHELSDGEREEIRSIAHKNHISIQAGTRGLTIENIERYISIAGFFRSPFIRIVIDTDDYRPNPQDIIRIIRTLLPLLKENGIILAIENHDRLPSKVLEKIIRDTSKEYVGICLDTANSIGTGEGIHEVVATLAPYTVNLHIKDILIKRVSHKMGFSIQGAAAGQGMLDIPWIINQLESTGRCSTATLELWPDESDTVDNTIRKERQWANASIQYLKKILS